MPNQSPTLLSRRKKRMFELRRAKLWVSYDDVLARYLNIGRYPQLGVGYSGVVHYPNNTRYPWLALILSWLLDGAMWVRRKLHTAEEELDGLDQPEESGNHDGNRHRQTEILRSGASRNWLLWI